MEKPLTRKELLSHLIAQAEDPFCSTQELQDLRNILFQSDTFSGMNHLYLVTLYLKKEFSLFSVTKEQALEQCALALKEGNKRAYFYFYLVYKKDGDWQKARNSLRLSCDFKDREGYLWMGKELLSGELFPKDERKALSFFEKAIQAGEKKGYDELLFHYLKNGEKEKAKEILVRAEKDSYPLPGVVE